MALTMQFVCHRFLDYHDPTIEDAYQHQAVIDGEAAQLDILDTAGQPEFTAMRDQYMREGEGFIICYSMIERRSFEEAIAYKQLIDRVRNRDDIPCVLAANKCDLEELRKVSTEEGRQLAQQFDCPFYETSAALRTNVDDTFSSLIREIRRKEKEAMIALEKRNRKRNRARRIQNFFQRINVFKRTESS
ncbi:GTP-binding protein Rit1 isoform X2 [Lingula anatina]|uniref:small monomeric GTPase n=1 Tax=Lingula anatina TaxID=7574 RepID=A0A1S3JNG2_LINAN|nr:GTP-binding protein Rit1 isoform X2 [Lingula anatina]|eukprot:XP_013411499.1 GTP-binding protein Rit1 isoform X2 [Lingula anatina]